MGSVDDLSIWLGISSGVSNRLRALMSKNRKDVAGLATFAVHRRQP